jgi:hypothetical protein
VAVDRLRATGTASVGQPTRLSRPIVDQPVDTVTTDLTAHGVTVRRERYDPAKVERLSNLFRTPPAGSTVTLYEEGGVVRYYDFTTPAPEPADRLRVRVRELSEALHAKDAELQSLRTQVETLTQKQAELETRASAADVAGFQAELEELRRFREEVTRFMRESRR